VVVESEPTEAVVAGAAASETEETADPAPVADALLAEAAAAESEPAEAAVSEAAASKAEETAERTPKADALPATAETAVADAAAEAAAKAEAAKLVDALAVAVDAHELGPAAPNVTALLQSMRRRTVRSATPLRAQ
jgi:hypothetical protein